MKIFQYPRCGTCRKAAKWLDQHGLEPASIDIVESPPSKKQLMDLHKRSGLELKAFFNTSGQSYRNGGFKDRLANMSDLEQFEALAADGKLIKRPILDTGDTVLVGFREAEYESLV